MSQERLKRRADGRYQVSWKDPQGRRQYFYGTTAKEARAERELEKARVLTGTQTRRTNQTFGQYMDRWLEEARGRCKYNTWYNYRSLVKIHVRPALGPIPLTEVRRSDVQALANAMIAGQYAPKTVDLVVRIVSAVMIAAGPDGDEYLLRNPAKRISRPEVQERTGAALDAGELRRFLAAAPNHEMGDLFLVKLYTASRGGEMRGLLEGAIDWERRLLAIEGQVTRTEAGPAITGPKTRLSRRVVPLTAPALAALERQADTVALWKVQHGWTGRGLVFPNWRTGGFINEVGMRKAFQEVLADAKITTYHTPHDLRHTAETMMAASGVDVRTRMAILGHKSAEMAAHYTTPLREMQEAALELVARQVG